MGREVRADGKIGGASGQHSQERDDLRGLLGQVDGHGVAGFHAAVDQPRRHLERAVGDVTVGELRAAGDQSGALRGRLRPLEEPAVEEAAAGRALGHGSLGGVDPRTYRVLPLGYG